MSASSILLVEDHAGFAKALLNMLGQNPNLHVVAVAESAEAALTLSARNKRGSGLGGLFPARHERRELAGGAAARNTRICTARCSPGICPFSTPAVLWKWVREDI